MTKEKKNMGFGMIAIGVLFFWNPNIGIIDLLPDFLGYILLCLGLSRLADLNESISGAYSLFKKMILIDAGKWLALLWVFGISVPGEQSSSHMLWSFVFAVAEMICLIPAYYKLFDGINQLGYFYANTSIFVQGTAKKKNATDRIRAWTVAFVSLKAMLSFLPELADLTNNVYDEGSEWMNLYRYIGVLRMMAFLPILILGLVWLVKIERYFRAIRKDRALIGGLSARYEKEIAPKTGLFACRNFQTLQVVLLIALCLSVDFRLENRNYIPDFLCSIFLLVAFIMLHRFFHVPKRIWIPVWVSFGVTTVLSFLLENRFFERFTYSAIIKNDEAGATYMTLIVINILQSLLWVAVMLLVIQGLQTVIKAHTGFVLGRERQGVAEEKMIDALHHDLNKALLWGFVWSVLYAISDVAYLLLIPEFGFANLLSPVFAVICIGMMARATFAIGHAMNTKYMLE